MKMDQNNMQTFGALFTGSLIKKLCFFSFLFLSVNSAALDDGTWTYELDGNSVMVTGCFSACPYDLVIPRTIAGSRVTGIGNYAFQDNQLTNVTIPNNVTSIGIAAFWGNNLTSVGLPSSLSTIGNYAFYQNQLTAITIPDNVISIGKSVFWQNALTKLIISDSVTSIGERAFQYNRLTSVIIPDSVTSIGSSAFSSNRLTNVTILGDLNSIADHTFSYNQLTSFSIPASVNSIGRHAFFYNQLTSITIPSSVTYIGSSAFAINQLASIIFLGDRFYIEDVFGNNFDLSSIHYCPDRIGWPGSDVQSVTPSVKCESVNNFEGFEYLVQNDSIALLGCTNTCPADLIIPETIDGYSVNTIVEFAFSNKELNSVIIPSSVTSIEDYAFSDNQLTSISIPYGVTSISSHAFAYNQLVSVVIPISVTTIGNEAFKENQLESVILPDRLVSVEKGVFRHNKLASIAIPSSVVSIGNGAFNNNKLTSITIPASVVSIGVNTFNKNNLVNISFLGQRPTLNTENSFLGNGAITEISYCAGMVGWPGDDIKKTVEDYITPSVATLNDDDDCDGVTNTLDPFPNNPFEWMDTDSDGMGNNADTDDDGDGILDSLDTYPLDSTNQPQKLHDIDGSGEIDALTDSLLIMRYTFGFTGDDLIDGAIGEGATRTSPEEIEAYLEALIPEL